MSAGLVHLPSVFDIAAVGTLAIAIRAAVASDAVVFEAGDVTRVDASGIQLLCATVLAARARGSSVVWRSLAQVVRDGARSLGVEGLLAFDGAGSIEGAT